MEKSVQGDRISKKDGDGGERVVEVTKSASRDFLLKGAHWQVLVGVLLV